jgi:hypothetical protein
MGRPFFPDAYVYHETTGNRVPNRIMPGGLDLLAALGSERALEIESQFVNADARLEYAERAERVGITLLGSSDGAKPADLYENWLHALTPLLAEPGEGYPAFMRSPAWVDKGLQSALASRIQVQCESRVKPQPSDSAGSARGVAVTGYVEPYPRLYGQLAAVARAMREGLATYGSLPEDVAGRLTGLEEFLRQLAEIAASELQGSELTEAQVELLRDVPDTLERLVTFDRSPSGVGDGRGTAVRGGYIGEQGPCVVDLFYNREEKRHLQGAVGEALTIYVLVPIGEELALAQGALLAYYEFPWTNVDELTTAEWESLSRPEAPSWTSSFIVPK